MLQGYWQHGMHETAVFEFFVRKLPKHRNFLVTAGLEQAIGYLEELAFSPAEIEWLAQTRRFQPEFIRWLEKLRFTGDVNAMLPCLSPRCASAQQISSYFYRSGCARLIRPESHSKSRFPARSNRWRLPWMSRAAEEAWLLQVVSLQFADAQNFSAEAVRFYTATGACRDVVSSNSSSAVSRSKTSGPLPDSRMTRDELIARTVPAAAVVVREDHDAVCSRRDRQRSLQRHCSPGNTHLDGARLRALFLRRAIGVGSRRMRS